MSKKNKNKKSKQQPKQAKTVSLVASHDQKKQYLNEKQKRAVDGFANMAARLGVSPTSDNQLSDGHYELNDITKNRVQLEAAYRGSWVVGAMIDSRAEDMTRAGLDMISNDAAMNIEDFQAGLKRLEIFSSLQDGLKWGSLYGGAIGVIVIEGQDLSTPLNVDTVAKGQFKGISIFDRWQVNPDLQRLIKSGPKMGLPAFYTIVTGTTYNPDDLGDDNKRNNLKQGSLVHHSRVIRFTGVKLPYWQAVTNQMWGMSVIERVFDRLISFDTATLSAANLVNYAHLRTVRINNLRETMVQGGDAEEAMIRSFEYMRMFQNNEGITLLDKEDEYSSNSYTFAGLSDVLLNFGQQLAGGSEIPLVRLFGQSPAGLSSTGESDLRNYYDNINSKQERDLREPMQTILNVAYRSMFSKTLPTDFNFSFTALWQMTAVDKATIGETITRSIISAYEAGALSFAACLKELRHASKVTGLFSNITDEDIEAAEEANPPDAEFDVENETFNMGKQGLEVSETLLEKIKKKFGKGKKLKGKKTNPEKSDEAINPNESLNGAQVSSMLEIVSQVNAGTLPRETAVSIMATSFPISEQQASSILGAVGRGFKASSEGLEKQKAKDLKRSIVHVNEKPKSKPPTGRF